MRDVSGFQLVSDDLGLGHGPITDVAEAARALRHVVINDHMVLSEAARTAEQGAALARKALDRLDDLTGVPGQRHVDGGGAIGRIEESVRAMEGRVRAGVRAVQWGIGTLVAIAGVGATILTIRR